MYYCFGISDPGTIRKINEDAFLINKIIMTKANVENKLNPPFIIAVADGVGGENTGEIASRMCLEMLSDVKFSANCDLTKEIIKIHYNIKKFGLQNNSSRNMQTTLCALAVDEENNAYILNIGDSRMYRLTDEKVVQVSKDQSLAQLLLDTGKIKCKDELSTKSRHAIFPVIGNISSEPVLEYRKIDKIVAGEILLLCSDGLTDFVTDIDIENTLNNHTLSLKERILNLVSLSITKGSKDNVTVLAISDTEE